MPQFLQVSSLILHNHSGTAKQLGKQQFWKSCSSDQKNLTGTLQPVLIKWQLDSQGHTRGETALSHPSLQSSTHPSGAVFGFRGRRELRHAKRLPQGKKIHPVWISVVYLLLPVMDQGLEGPTCSIWTPWGQDWRRGRWALLQQQPETKAIWSPAPQTGLNLSHRRLRQGESGNYNFGSKSMMRFLSLRVAIT